MLRRAYRKALALAPLAALAAVLGAGAGAPSSAAALTFIPCPAANAFTCSSVFVPLDRSGGLPGSIQLSVERKAHSASPTPSAVLALAGGPGQAALPLGEPIAQLI